MQTGSCFKSVKMAPFLHHFTVHRGKLSSVVCCRTKQDAQTVMTKRRWQSLVHLIKQSFVCRPTGALSAVRDVSRSSFISPVRFQQTAGITWWQEEKTAVLQVESGVSCICVFSLSAVNLHHNPVFSLKSAAGFCTSCLVQLSSPLLSLPTLFCLL